MTETLPTQQIQELVRNNVIFRSFAAGKENGDGELNEAIKIINISKIKAGNTVFKQGDPGDSIVLLLKGEVAVCVTGEDGDEIPIARVKENNFVGEMAIIDETDRMASVRAISDCLVGIIFSEDFWKYFDRYQVLAKNVLKGINQRLRETNASYIERLTREKEELEKQVKEKTEDLRQKDLQLLEMDRIAGIGTLAAGISHEINNPLGFVKSSAGYLKKSLDKMIGAVRYWDDKPVPEPLLKDYNDYLAQINFDHIANSLETKYDRVKRGIERIMRIVNSLKSFSQVDMETVGRIDINQSIEEAVEILDTQESKGVEFVKEFQEVPPMECFSTEINQCLLHILRNALDALDNKGRVKIMTSYDEKKDYVITRINDNGKGMSAEIMRQALNPFFTTKPVGSGTGVGLSLTERIIKRHGGDLKIYSKEGDGTTVTMTLPVANIANFKT